MFSIEKFVNSLPISVWTNLPFQSETRTLTIEILPENLKIVDGFFNLGLDKFTIFSMNICLIKRTTYFFILSYIIPRIFKFKKRINF